MGFKLLISFSEWKKLALLTGLFFGIFYSLGFSQSTSDAISFTKREIAVFKWGDGPQKVGIGVINAEDAKRDIQNHKDIEEETGEAIPNSTELKAGSTYFPQTEIRIDGNDNVYFTDGIHHRTFIVSADGKLIKTIPFETTGGFYTVDESGDIYGDYYKKGEPLGLIVTKPDGKKDVYKNYDFRYVENGIAYDMKGKALTITDNGDKPEKLPPRLMSFTFRKEDEGNILGWNSVLKVTAGKINNHLKKINRRLDVNEITIKIEQKEKLTGEGSVLGADDVGNIYVLSTYKNGIGPHSTVIEGYIDVYSPQGERLDRISEPSCIGNYQGDPQHFAIDIRGNVFEILTSDDGVHIIKWVKN
jgi:hypothetical protein